MKIKIFTKDVYVKLALQAIVSSLNNEIDENNCSGNIVIFDCDSAAMLNGLYGLYPICMIIFLVSDNKDYNPLKSSFPFEVCVLNKTESLSGVAFFIAQKIRSALANRSCNKYSDLKARKRVITYNEEIVLSMMMCGNNVSSISEMTRISVKNIYNCWNSAKKKLNVSVASMKEWNYLLFVFRIGSFSSYYSAHHDIERMNHACPYINNKGAIKLESQNLYLHHFIIPVKDIE